MTKKNAEWIWTDVHEQSFKKIKNNLRSDALLNYYDPDRETQLIVDASPVGLGALLIQTDKDSEKQYAINYASKSLSPTE